ncbi:MAG: FkbM family methyltransferase [Bacteroidia bacterium]
MKKFFKKVYDFIPFKKEVFSILKYFWKPKKSIYQHLHFKGILTIKIDKQTNFKMKHYGYQIENEIFWTGLTGGWERVSLGIWIKLCKNAEVVFDIGANTGVYSLIAKAINAKANVYAFEPVKRVFEKLTENNKLNNFDIMCLPVAASNFNGKAKIYDTATEHTYSVTVNKNLNPETIGTIITEIDVVTLDSIIEKDNLQKIDILKIDVETHEAEVLEGFRKNLKLFKPTILIEILTDEVGENVQKIVEGLDYLYFNIDEEAGIRQVNKISKSDYFNYLLCSKQTAKSLNLID